MFNPFHPEPSPGSFLWNVEEMNSGTQKDTQRYCWSAGLWGKCGWQWFLLSLWGLRHSLYFCVCAEGGVPCASTCSCRCPCLCTYKKGRVVSGTLLCLSLPYAPETGRPTVQGLTVLCLRSVVGSPRELPSPSAPNDGVTGVHSHTQLFIWELDPDLHAWVVRAITYWVIFPAPKSNCF